MGHAPADEVCLVGVMQSSVLQAYTATGNACKGWMQAQACMPPQPAQPAVQLPGQVQLSW